MYAKERLENLPIIKCAEGEKILCIQRQHPIVLIIPMVGQIIATVFILSSLIFIFHSLVGLSLFTLSSSTLIAYTTLVAISILFIIETFTFMTWYYQFYIITNKAIVHRNSFRMAGFYSESVMLNQMHEQRMERDSPNLIYDFLKIQDLYIFFHKLEREEPFVFKTPDNAQVLEDLLQGLIIKSDNTQEPTKNEPN